MIAPAFLWIKFPKKSKHLCKIKSSAENRVRRRQAKRDERALEMRADIDGLEPQVEEVVEDVGEDDSVVMEDIKMKVRAMKLSSKKDFAGMINEC